MITLTKYEDQYSRDKYEYEVLEREKIEEIIDNLDRYEVSRKLTEEAVKHSGEPAHAFAEITIEDGSIVYQAQMNNQKSKEPNLWIRLMDFGDVQRLGDVPKDYILYPEEIDEIHKLMDKDIHGDSALSYGEAYEKVVEDNNIDIDERIKEYYLDYYAPNLEFNNDIKERLDVVYTND